jgi:two-component system response regulator AlgR
VAGEASNGRQALEQAQQLEPDTILLDIRMPGMDGLEAARHLSQLEQPPAVIFTTAYDEFGVQAFEARAVDYLLKPVRRERLAEALSRASQPNRAQLAALSRRSEGGRARQHLSARIGHQLKLVPVAEVLYFRAEQKYVVARYSEGEILLEESLVALEEEFDERFQRIHRNALVAVDAVDALEKATDGHFQVRIRGTGELLDVSRRMVADVRRRLKAG